MDSAYQNIPFEPESEEFSQEFQKLEILAERNFEYGEYCVIELDTIAMTAKLI